MAAITDLHNEWRDQLVLASFSRVPFHVEVSARTSGQRIVVHEYPKRDDPYSEIMGKHAVRWSFTAYILLNDHLLYAAAGAQRPLYNGVVDHRDALIRVLEAPEEGWLMHPSIHSDGAMLVVCEHYSVTESQQKGGYYEFDLQFVEVGLAPQFSDVDTVSVVKLKAEAADSAAVGSINATIKSLRAGL